MLTYGFELHYITVNLCINSAMPFGKNVHPSCGFPIVTLFKF